jgi:hypothetical protein
MLNGNKVTQIPLFNGLLGRVCKLKPARKHRHISSIKRAIRLAEEPLDGLRALNKAGVLRHIDHHRAYTLPTKTTSLEFAEAP